MKYLKLLSFFMLLPLMAMAEESSGTTGDCIWTFDTETGVLTISGEGAMGNYWEGREFLNPPWGFLVKKVNIEEGVTTIGRAAFWSCSLTSVTIPNSVTKIDVYAFDGCTGLTSVTIPNSVTTIGAFAFSDCTGLTSVTIPNSVTSIENGAFYNCDGLEKVIVSDIAAWCNITFGDYSGPSSLHPRAWRATNPLSFAHHLYSDENTEITNLVIPDGVTSIGDYAFYRCSGLTSVTIPNSVTSIGDYAFEGCGLTSVTVDSGNTKYDSRNNCNAIIETATNTLLYGSSNATIPNDITSIADHAFENCTGLTSITIPNSVTSIGSYAFENCTGLTSITIPNSVTSIGSYAFDGCSGLTSVTVGNGVTSIGSYAFRGCSELTNLTIGNGVTSIEKYAFYNCSGLTSLTIPNSVTSIEEYAFYKCSGLTSLTIPNSVTSIRAFAFAGCSGLTNLTIGNGVTSIEGCAFDGCSGLTSVTIPNSVTSIGNGAFRGCIRLKSVTLNSNYIVSEKYTLIYGNINDIFGQQVTKYVIGDDVTSIGDYAFYGYDGNYGYNSNRLTSVTIGKGVTAIGNDAFHYCSKLEKVIVPDIAAWCKINFSDSDDNPLYFAKHLYSDENTEITNLVIPYGVTSIGDYAFEGFSSLTSVTIPNSVTSIGENAFEGCSGLTSVTIPNSVTSIGENAFEGCSGLTSVTIPNSVISIGENAFYNCTGLTKVIVPNIATWCKINFSDSDDNPLYYAKHLYSDENTEITKLVIPDGVMSIGDYAFYRCTGLTSITIPSSVTSIGGYAFDGCSGLTKVIVPDIAAWCNITFDNASSNPLSIAHALYLYSDENTKITNLIIPDGVTSIRERAFRYCTGLTSVTIPNSVKSIGAGAFYSCTGLNSVTFGNGVTEIGNYAFYNCSELRSVTIPKSVADIGNSAFYGCKGLTSVTSYIEDPFALSSYAFYSLSSACVLYVPYGTRDKYISEGWTEKIFKGGIVEMDETTSIEEIEDNGGEGDVYYNLSGQRVVNPTRGVYILNGKKIMIR